MQRSDRAMSRLPDIVWQKTVPAAEKAAVAAALAQPGLVDTTLARLYSDGGAGATFSRFTGRHLATGGAKRVYLIQAMPPDGRTYAFVLKQFLPIRLAHLPPRATIAGMTGHAAELDARLLQHMVWAARRVDERAPGLCPRFGGFWEWRDEDGQAVRVMTEAYVEGHSLDRWKAILEDRFVQGELDFAGYTKQRRALERLAIAAYVRLWDVLGRQTFTSDPSPWNVLLTPTDAGYQPSIIDLHSLHDGGTALYVFQTLEELFGSRDEIREHALCPGILDALGAAEGVRFLDRVRRGLDAQGELRQRAGLTSYATSGQAITRFLAARRSGASHGHQAEDPL
jgi:hypothetical protein